MAGFLGTKYTREQIDAIPGLFKAMVGAIDEGRYAGLAPPQAAGRFLDYAMRDPVSWVSNNLDDSIFSGYYNNKDYTLVQSQIDYLRKANVPESQITSAYNNAVASANERIGVRESSSSFNPFAILGGLALSFFLPGIGSAIAGSLLEAGIVTSELAANVIGNAIANTAASVAQGQTLDKALTNAVVGVAVSTGSLEAAKELNTLIGHPAVTDAIVSAAGSAVKTAAAGGTEQDIVNNMTGALAGSAASSAYQLGGEDYTKSTGRVIGSAVAGAVTGGTTGAITGAIGELGGQSKGKVAGAIEDVFSPQDTGALPASQVAAMTPETDAGVDTSADALNRVEVSKTKIPSITDTNVIDTIAKTTPVSLGLESKVVAPVLEDVEIRKQRPSDITDTDVINAMTKETTPAAAAPAAGVSTPVLERVEVRAKKLPSDITSTDIIDEPAKLEDVTVTDKKEEPLLDVAVEEPPPEEKPPEEKPYKPDLFILGGKKPKAPPSKTPTSVLSQALGTTTGLTASRGAGEIEDPSTGKKKRKVWNEETLRLKDALGV